MAVRDGLERGRRPPPRAPAPTWWAHDSACAWTAAWLTVRGWNFLGQRELLSDPEWSGKIDWLDRHSLKQSGHRPDLVVVHPQGRVAVEVELAAKSLPRLNAILRLHLAWLVSRKTSAVVYVCGDQGGCDRIEKAANTIGLVSGTGRLRIETLDTIKTQTLAGYEQSRRPGRADAA